MRSYLSYYAIYANECGWDKGEPPDGIIVEQRVYAADWSSMEYHAMHWDHRAKAWAYDPTMCADFLSEEDNEDRQRAIDRDEAERITPAITGGEELPDEDTIQWIFQWKGDPPQAEDTPDRWLRDR